MGEFWATFRLFWAILQLSEHLRISQIRVGVSANPSTSHSENSRNPSRTYSRERRKLCERGQIPLKSPILGSFRRFFSVLGRFSHLTEHQGICKVFTNPSITNSKNSWNPSRNYSRVSVKTHGKGEITVKPTIWAVFGNFSAYLGSFRHLRHICTTPNCVRIRQIITLGGCQTYSWKATKPALKTHG